ncbi:MAG: DUF4350 domain-containing protein [Candidatus Heimdallarchaeota archaeon]|nr:DUF4350 domain-containing protein [Candidatus Heimdallarchaeota archaeon]
MKYVGDSYSVAKKRAKKFFSKFDRNVFLLVILFIIFCLPLLLSITRIGQEETRQFSIYNTQWDGTSILRSNLEAQGFEVRPMVSTLNSLIRIDEPGVLAIIGPTNLIDPTESMALLYFLSQGGSVIIADDFGSSNNILGLLSNILSPFLGGRIDTLGVPIKGLKINQSLLMDAQSYHLSPVMPVLRNFQQGEGFPSVDGVSSVVTSYPSAISFLVKNEATNQTHWVPTFSYEGSPIPSGLAVSTDKSWLEKDVEKAKKGEFYPDEDEWGGVPFSVILPIPIGGEMGFGNILICSDPSIFVNEFISLSNYDNARLANNLFDWLDYNNTGRIYFDESHLSIAEGRIAHGIIDPFTYVGLYLRIVNTLTMFPLLAPLFPLIAYFLLKATYPKSSEPSPLLMTKIKQGRSRSFFAAKMAWYMNYRKFDRALDLLYKRLKRQFHRKMRIEDSLNAETILALLRERFPEEFNFEEVGEALERIETVTRKSKKLSGEEFTELVLVLKQIEETISKPRG